MEWNEWIGKKVFIKLIDGSVFSESLIKDVDDKFISLIDKFGNPATISISQIIKIVEDDDPYKILQES